MSIGLITRLGSIIAMRVRLDSSSGASTPVDSLPAPMVDADLRARRGLPLKLSAEDFI